MNLTDYNHLGKKNESVDDLAWGEHQLSFKELNILYSVLMDVVSNSQDEPSERINELKIIIQKLREAMNVIR